MATVKKQELAVIDFTQFSVAQLPELKGKKEEIASVIEANPIVEIVDNATYESAKKSRTAVKTLRTGLEKEQKDVKKKIKECVLDIVDKEYDTLVLGVKSAEQSRQEPIDAWETKKEQERQEKARLEQERIDGIKTKISDYVASWKEAFGFMFFGSIKEVSENFAESNANFDKNALQEFDVLFDREVSTLTELLENKISTLEEQEQIRIDQENLKIQNQIADWSRDWNSKIIFSTTSENCKELFKEFNAESGMNCKQFQKEYAERRSDLVSLFEARIKMLIDSENAKAEQEKTAEEQRIAQEKLNQEKKDFEEKQAEAKFQDRCKRLTDAGSVYSEEKNGFEKTGHWYHCDDIRRDSDEMFERELEDAKNPIEAIEVVAEEVVELPLLEETDNKNTSIQMGRTEFLGIQYTDKQGKKTIVEPSESVKKEVEEILNSETQEVEFEETLYQGTYKNLSETVASFELVFAINDLPKFEHLTIKELLENYNVPTKKQ